MLRSKAVAEVKRYMGMRQDGDDDIIDWMQLGQAHLERNWPTRPLPHFLITERTSSATVGDEERVPLPLDFIEEYEQDALWVIDSNGGEHLLGKYDADDLRRYDQKYRSAFNTQVVTDRMPVQYALTGTYFRLFPKPDIVYTLKMICHATDLPLTSDIENGWLKHAPYVLIGWAGERFSMATRDPDGLTMFGQMKASAMAALDVQTVEKEMANRRMAMGETA